MEKYGYNSYPDSADSSPRSREIDFENPSPWEDSQQQPPPQNSKAKFMCSYGGKIQPRPHDNQLAYVGGETKILSVDRGIRFAAMISKLAAICGGDGDVSFKYQLPGEDLDALISVTNDDDLEHMMHEYDRLFRTSSKPARMRLFLFLVELSSGRFGSDGSTKSERDRFVEALNSVPPRSETEKPVIAPPNNSDFLFGLEKPAAQQPQAALKIHDGYPEQLPPGAPVIGDQRMISPDQAVNQAEIQRQLQDFHRMQIRDQEIQQHQQQQEAMYRRKSEDNIMEPGGYYAQTYVQNQPPGTGQQTGAPAQAGFWQGKHVQGGVFPGTTPGLQEQRVYMIPAQGPGPGTVYHAPPSAVAQPVSGQPIQGYYTNMQRMPSDGYKEHPAYNMVQQPPPPQSTQQQQQQQFSGGSPHSVPPGRPVSGGHTIGLTDAGYTPVYYTGPGGGIMVQPPPPYQGAGVAVNSSGEMRTSQDGKVVPRVSPGSM